MVCRVVYHDAAVKMFAYEIKNAYYLLRVDAAVANFSHAAGVFLYHFHMRCVYLLGSGGFVRFHDVKVAHAVGFFRSHTAVYAEAGDKCRRYGEMILEIAERVLAEGTVALAAQRSCIDAYKLDVACTYALIARYFAVK